MSVLALWKLLPRWAKEVIVLLVFLGATYAFAEHNGRTVQRQQDTTAEEARRIAVLAHMREAAKDTARAERDSAQVRRDTLTRTITRFVTIRASEPTVIPDADHDTLHVRYRDGTVRLLPVSDPVDSLVHSLVSQLALADTTIQRAKVANDADSVAIAKLWHASIAADSLIDAQQAVIDPLRRSVARATHGVAWDTGAGCLTGAAAGGAVKGTQGAIVGGVIGCGSGYLLHALRH